MATGGEVFVLDMGDPVKIVDLAKRMIELSGLSLRDKNNPDGDIEIEVVGLRPGEKLYEELLIGDSPEATGHARIMKARDGHLDWSNLNAALAQFTLAAEARDWSGIHKVLMQVVPEFQSHQQPVDWLYARQKDAA
jgi:FlaA1/EpsC-like NDP-sugar epimerase